MHHELTQTSSRQHTRIIDIHAFMIFIMRSHTLAPVAIGKLADSGEAARQGISTYIKKSKFESDLTVKSIGSGGCTRFSYLSHCYWTHMKLQRKKHSISRA